MARHREFDRDEALHKAMEVFWSRGYEAASIQELIKHMGINRQSLYDTFGDKHALYLQALDRYREMEGHKLFELLERQGSVKNNLRQLFKGVRDPRAVARFLYSSIQGLSLMAKATQDRRKLEDVVKVTLSVLD